MYKRCKECGYVRHIENEFTSEGASRCNSCKETPNPHRPAKARLPHEEVPLFNMNGEDEIFCG